MLNESKIHAVQTQILRELLFHRSAGYAELQKPTGLESDHFNFHISRLVELGYVDKIKPGEYKLSTKGKEYANRMDTEANEVERQPKVAVLVAVEGDDDKWLFQERRKNPFYGYWGHATGKISWGETIVETAARELMEEANLTANFRIAGLMHERVFSKESSELLEDKMFFVVHATKPSGKLNQEFEGGANFWLTHDEVGKKDKYFETLFLATKIARGEYSGDALFHEYEVRPSEADF